MAKNFTSAWHNYMYTVVPWILLNHHNKREKSNNVNANYITTSGSKIIDLRRISKSRRRAPLSKLLPIDDADFNPFLPLSWQFSIYGG